ncbi:MAG: hypothetical protein K2X77_23770 [Candidatus Obscuribacterales bacterium]|jgi:hypothetical protein|nr:hypothetical protein [Candidatus Obscuribacterales bacterium]
MTEDTIGLSSAQNTATDRLKEVEAPSTVASPELSNGNQVGGREIQGLRAQGNTDLPTVLLWDEQSSHPGGGSGGGGKGSSEQILDKKPSTPSSDLHSGSISPSAPQPTDTPPSSKTSQPSESIKLPQSTIDSKDRINGTNTEKMRDWDEKSSAGTAAKPDYTPSEIPATTKPDTPSDVPATPKADLPSEGPQGLEFKNGLRTAHYGETVVAKFGEKITAEKGSTVFAEHGSVVIAKDGSWVSAKNGAEVIAKDGSIVHAEDGSHVTAKDGSKVFANKGSKVVARDGSYVEAGEGSEVRAQDGSNVSALKGSGVQAEYGSHVEACDGSTVRADAGSDVNAWKGSLVIADKDSTVTKKDEGAKIYLEQGAELRDESK